MYARLQTTETLPTDDSVVPILTDTIASHPGYAGVLMLADDHGGAMVTLWESREDAELAAERTAARLGPRPIALTHDAVYEVDADLAGAAAGKEPAVAYLDQFDGPLSPERLDATRLAGTERIGPALQAVPGLVRTLVLWHPSDRAMAVLHIATSREALQRVTTAIRTSVLLPGEDPALLPGPDRVRVLEVAAYRAMPARVSR
jgi:hypothetical protein